MSEAYRPFVVRVWLARPMVVPAHPIMLDGLLEELAARAEGHRCARPVALPLERHAPDGLPWIYCASAFRLTVAERWGRVMTRRMPQHIIGQDQRQHRKPRQRRVDEGTGPDRNYFMPYATQSLAGPAVAYGIGDISMVRSLLGGLVAFGPKSRLHGDVERVEVEPHDDREAWLWRPTPDPTPERVAMVGTLRPPYWDRRGRAVGYVPEDWVS